MLSNSFRSTSFKTCKPTKGLYILFFKSMPFASCILSAIRCVFTNPFSPPFHHWPLVLLRQLTKAQLLSVLPQLVRHLSSDNYITYTYAAITIERVLFIKQGAQLVWVFMSYLSLKSVFKHTLLNWLRFSQADIHNIAPGLLNALLMKIESAGTAEKVAENDHLMKCELFGFQVHNYYLLTTILRRHAGHHYIASDANTGIYPNTSTTRCHSRCHLEES